MKIRNLTVEQLVHLCGKNMDKNCKGCKFSYEGKCIKILDLGIINIDEEIDLEKEIPNLFLLKPKVSKYPINENKINMCEKKIRSIEEWKKIGVEREKVLKEIKELGYEIRREYPNLVFKKQEKIIIFEGCKEEIECFEAKTYKLQNGKDFFYLKSLPITFKEYELIYKILSIWREIWRDFPND